MYYLCEGSKLHLWILLTSFVTLRACHFVINAIGREKICFASFDRPWSRRVNRLTGFMSKTENDTNPLLDSWMSWRWTREIKKKRHLWLNHESIEGQIMETVSTMKQLSSLTPTRIYSCMWIIWRINIISTTRFSSFICYPDFMGFNNGYVTT